MTIADEIAQAAAGARFLRADLHIHSYGSSHDVRDAGCTPDHIVQQAVREDLRLIAIADHNEIGNVDTAIKAASGKNVTVIPGVELSTPQGHLLAYFDSLETLQTFYGSLQLADKGTSRSRCQTAMLECLNKIEALKGFAILAHVDGDGGLESMVAGYPLHKADIICHPALIGLELRSAQSSISYSNSDPVSERAAIGNQRIEKLRLGKSQFLARVLFSDSHSLAAMGKNAVGKPRMTRMKMDSPCFDGVRIALQDSDARIRLEDEIPGSVPYLMGMKLDGGFLDGQVIHFSRNLNCIIGGRGAGKSTALEAARIRSPLPSSNRLVDSEVWPNVLQLVWVDEAGNQHTIRRRHGESSENLDDLVLGSTEFPMECYGQNETAQTSDRAEKDPSALLKYLDQFTDVSALQAEDEQLRDRLLTNQSEIEKAQQQVNLIPENRRLLNSAQLQLKTLESANARDFIALQRKVAEERTIRETIESSLVEITNDTESTSVPELIAGICDLAKVDDLKVGPKEYEQIVIDLKAFETKAAAARLAITKDARILTTSVKKQLESWKIHEKTIAEEIEKKRKELLAKGIKLDGQYIKKLADDESRYKKNLDVLKVWEKKLKDARLARTGLIKERFEHRVGVFNRRMAYSIKANSALRNALGDLSVDVKFLEGALSQEAETIITEAMGWRTSQVPKAALLVEQVTIPGLIAVLSKKNPTPITKITSNDGSKPFGISDGREIISVLSAAPVQFRLERCAFEDKPRITVTKRLVESGKPPRFVSRDFSRLSLGQQQSVLLALMLSSDSRYPLIIDQPEDNLDSEFIFHSLVPVLRAAKERRQIIVVTHNPNIAVLGDAEKILAFKSTSDKSVVVADGSIDDVKTRSVVCQVLEGAEEAFRRRAQIYGVR